MYAIVAVSALAYTPRGWSQGPPVFSRIATNAPLNSIVRDPDGYVWGADDSSNALVRIRMDGQLTSYPLPTPLSGPVGPTIGPDGAVWFVETGYYGNRIGRLRRDTGELTEFLIPTPQADPFGIAAGPDGALWFTESGSGKLGRISVEGAISEYPIPALPFNTGPVRIIQGPDRALWFTVKGLGSAIGRITTEGSITLYPLTPYSDPVGLTEGEGEIWFTELYGNRIGRISTAGVFGQPVLLPTGDSQPIEVARLPSGDLWIAESAAFQVASVNTRGEVREYSTPSTGQPNDVLLGPDGNLWISFYGAATVLRLVLSTVPVELMFFVAE